MFYQSLKLLIIATISVIFLSGCMTTDAVKRIGKVQVYDGLEAVVVWDDGSITLKDSEIEISALSKILLNKSSESYYYITTQDIKTLSKSITDKDWLELNYKPFRIDSLSAANRINQIEKVLESSTPHKEKNVFAFYNYFYGQIKYPNKSPSFAITIKPSRRRFIQEYRTAFGECMQILIIPAACIDIVTFPIQIYIAKKDIDDAFQ